MLVELKLVEQRYRAVMDVLDGMSVTDVARRNGVSRQSVHTWLRRYANGGMAALADKSTKPESCPHQMAPVVEARVVELRRSHPRWGPRSIRTHLANEGFSPVPGRSSIYRTLVRHHLVEPTPRKRSRADYKRWERSRSMELWQMDVVGRFHLADGTEVKVVTGIDDHSRFCVCARVVARATARPVCEALQWALARTECPTKFCLTTAKSSTARFGQGPGPVLFDRIGIRHILTAPYSPTTTGKVERFHKTMRSEFLVDHDRVHATIEELQRALDAWVDEYNTKRPHQSLGDRPPLERFALAKARPADLEMPEVRDQVPLSARPPGVNRWVDQRGSIGLGGFRYRVGATFAEESVEVVVRGRARRDPPRRRPRRHPCRASPGGQGTRAPTRAACGSLPATHLRHDRHPPGGPGRFGLLRRSRLSGRTQLGSPGRRSGHRGRLSPDLGQGQGHQGPRHPPRPLQGARRLRHPPGSAP